MLSFFASNAGALSRLGPTLPLEPAGSSGRATDSHPPGGGLAEPGDQLEKRRLAGAAWPDEPDHRPGLNRERDLVQDVELSEPHLHLRKLDPARGSLTHRHCIPSLA